MPSGTGYFRVGDRVRIRNEFSYNNPGAGECLGTIRVIGPVDRHSRSPETIWNQIERDDRQSGGGIQWPDADSPFELWVAHDEEIELIGEPILMVGDYVRVREASNNFANYWGPGVITCINGGNVYVRHDNGRYACTDPHGVRTACFTVHNLELIRRGTLDGRSHLARLTDRPPAKRYGPFKPIAKRLPA
jgi:hypothetical protein